MLSLIVESALRSLILGVVVWSVLRVLRVRNPYTQSLVWRAVLFSALAMPLLMAFMERWVRSAPSIVIQWMPLESPPLMLKSLPDMPSGIGLSSFPWLTVATFVYVGVASALLLRMIAGLYRSRRLCRAAVPVNEAWLSGHDVRMSDSIRIPATFASTILVPADWDRWSVFQKEVVLLHESSHVRRRDFYVHLIAGFHRAVFWFNPLTLWLQDRLVELAEVISDDAALRKAEDRASYAEVLVRFATEATQARLFGMSMAHGRTLGRRVERVLRETVVARPGSALRRLLIGLFFVPAIGFAAGAWIAEPAIEPLIARFQTEPAVPAIQTAAAQQEVQPRGVVAPARGAQTTPAAQGYLAKWPEAEVPYIISTPERNAFARLRTDEEREMFIETFWLRKDPTPGTVENEFRDEYYRRIVLANERFTSPGGPGWQSDRGRVLIHLGLPDEMESHPATVELDRATGQVRNVFRTEMWRYKFVEGLGQNKIFVFVDPAGEGVYRLQLNPGDKDPFEVLAPPAR
jgi:GWxTD domain-containing protein